MKILIGMIVLGLLYMGYSNDNAMAKCQEKHSFDTCFVNLNR